MLHIVCEYCILLWGWVTGKTAYEKIMKVSETTVVWKNAENNMWDWILANPTLHIGWFEHGKKLVTKVIENYMQFLHTHPEVVRDEKYLAGLQGLLNPPPWWPSTPKGGFPRPRAAGFLF